MQVRGARASRFPRARGEGATSDRLSGWAEKCRIEKVPKTKCVMALNTVFETVGADALVGSPTEDWLTVRRALDATDALELKRTGDHARYLRLLCRGSAIEDRLGELWKQRGDYAGAEAASDEAIIQDQLMDNHREAFSISVMTMHQLKAREYDAVLTCRRPASHLSRERQRAALHGNAATTSSLPHASPPFCLHSGGEEKRDVGCDF